MSGPDTAAADGEALRQIARAVLVPTVAAMMADGTAADDEVAQLKLLCATSPIFRPLPVSVTTDLVFDVMQEIRRDGPADAIGRAAQALTPPLRETALAFTLRIALADGTLADDEKEALLHVAERLSIADEVFARILEVVRIMQRGPAT